MRASGERSSPLASGDRLLDATGPLVGGGDTALRIADRVVGRARARNARIEKPEGEDRGDRAERRRAFSADEAALPHPPECCGYSKHDAAHVTFPLSRPRTRWIPSAGELAGVAAAFGFAAAAGCAEPAPTFST